MKCLIFLLAILPAAALADPQEHSTSSTAASKVPPQPVVAPGVHGRPHNCAQDYPEAEMRAGIEGTATLSFLVTAEGAVTRVAVAKSSGNAELDAAAIACVSTWTYKPAMKDGVAVDKPWQASVAWKLHDDRPLSWAPSQPCTKFTTVTAAMLKGIAGRSWIGYRVMADGTAGSTAVLASSGNAGLDRAAQRCVAARRFDVAARPIPPEGLVQNILVDWNYELASSK